MSTSQWIAACIPAFIAFMGAMYAQWRRNASQDRERLRREDQLWGYRDGNGVLHEGVVGTITRTVQVVSTLDERVDGLINQATAFNAFIDESRKDRKELRDTEREIVAYGAAERERIWGEIVRLGGSRPSEGNPL